MPAACGPWEIFQYHPVWLPFLDGEHVWNLKPFMEARVPVSWDWVKPSFSTKRYTGGISGINWGTIEKFCDIIFWLVGHEYETARAYWRWWSDNTALGYWWSPGVIIEWSSLTSRGLLFFTLLLKIRKLDISLLTDPDTLVCSGSQLISGGIKNLSTLKSIE